MRSGDRALKAGGVSGDLEWWQANRGVAGADAAVLRGLLARLKAWKIEHDEERALQPGPFLKLAWDAVFGDEDEKVAEAIGQLEAALAAR
jgi:hypothetical protein